MSSLPVEAHRIDSLLDKAERYMMMRNMTPTEAAKAVLPKDLLSIPLADLRELAEDALSDRLSNRQTQARYRNSERSEELTRKRVQEATTLMSEAIAKRAAILARISYSYGGERLSLLEMPREGHVSLAKDARSLAETSNARASFHDRASKELQKAGKSHIAELATQRIVDLAIAAEEVWG